MIFDLIRNRRSIFPAQYNEEPIARETIEKILEAANWAPTHKKTEPWRFKVFLGDQKLKLGQFLSRKYQETDPKPKQVKINKLEANPVRSAAVIAICMQRDPEECVPEWEELAATAMAVQNMWLACTELGIGCYWSSPALVQFMDELVALNEGEKCLGLFYMGNYDGAAAVVERRSIWEKVQWLE